MFQLANRHQPLGIAYALTVAAIVHAAFVVFVLPVLLHVDPDEEAARVPPKAAQLSPKIKRDFIVRTRYEPPKPLPQKKPPKPEEEPKKEIIKKVDIDIDRVPVIQETNKARPKEASFLSEQDNKVEEETRAKETTLKDVLPGKKTPKNPEDALSPDAAPMNTPGDSLPKPEDRPSSQELAMATPTPKPKTPNRVKAPSTKKAPPTEVPRPEEARRPTTKETKDGPFVLKPFDTPPVVTKKSEDVVHPKPGEKGTQGDPVDLFKPSFSDYSKVFKDDAKTRTRPGRKRRRVFARHHERQRLMRGSLENMISHVKPGNHTSVNAHRSVYVGYISSIHRRIHRRWADEYLMSLDTQYPRSSPLQDASLVTTLELVIEAKSGKFEEVNIVSSSGQMMFDAEAIDTAWSVGRRPNAPPQIISPNGKIYMHWNFHRDGKQCGVFGVSIYIVQTDEMGRRSQDLKAIPDVALDPPKK